MTVNACHQGNNTTYINVNPALKAAFNYKVGTYWIYQDSLSGEVDSFCVNGNSDQYIYTSNSSTSPTIAAENISISINEYNVSPNLPVDTQYWGYNYEANEIDIQYENRIYPNTVVYATFINYPYDAILSISSIPYSDTGKVISIFNQLAVNSQTYQNVIEVNHYANLTVLSTDYIHNDTLFFAPSAGMIKMILHHPLDSLNNHRVWELQRYHIVK